MRLSRRRKNILSAVVFTIIVVVLGFSAYQTLQSPSEQTTLRLPPLGPSPKTMVISVKAGEYTIQDGSRQILEIIAFDQSNSDKRLEGVNIDGDISDTRGEIVTRFRGLTDEEGRILVAWYIPMNTPAGEYTVIVSGLVAGYTPSIGSTKFTIY